MADSRIDWPELAEAAVTALLGEPNRKLSRGRRWRYGTKGSLSVDLDKAAWFDFEAEEGGGLSKLIERKVGGDWKAARRWLEAQGLVEPWRPDRGGANRPVTRGAGRNRGGSGGPDRESAVRRPEAASRGDDADERRRRGLGLARAIWASTGPVAGSPVAAYLARRGTWPDSTIGADCPIAPAAVAWIERAALERALWRYKERGTFPDDTAGAMVAAYLPAGAEFVNPAVPRESLPVAVSLEALMADGRRFERDARWRRTRGVPDGAACSMPANGQGREIAIVEGECDGLAVALMARAGLNGLGDVAEVRAVGGTSGFRPDRAADGDGRAVVVMPDGPGKDGTGKAAGKAAGCAARLRAAGRRARVLIRPAGDEAGDPAGDLAALLVERAGRFDEEGRMDATQAEREAWRALLDLPDGPGE